MVDSMLLLTVAVAAVPAVPLVYILYIAIGQILIPYLLSLPFRKKLQRFPGPKPSSTFMGNVPDLVSKPIQQTMLNWVKEHGKIFKVELPTATALVVTDPEDIARVVKVERWEKFTEGYRNMEKITADTHPNFLTVDMGPYYRAIRKAVTPAFGTANLRQFFPTLLDLTERVCGHLATQGDVIPVDMDKVAQRLTIDVIGRFGFDRDFGATGFGRNEALGVVQALMVAVQKMQNPLNRWFWWRKEARELWAARMQFHALVSHAVQDLRERPPAPHCVLAHLLNLTDPDTGKPLSPKRLRCETALFWIAGFETTAHAISWTLMYVATHPEAEERLAAELSAVGLLATPANPEPRQLAWSDLASLRYVNAVIYEGLRLMPPASGGTARRAPHDTQLSGQSVPKGTMVWVPFYALQRSPWVWGADAEQFRPERWLAGSGAGEGVNGGATSGPSDAEVDEVVRAAATQTARGWMPFSEGPRNCVGQSLALLELRVALARLCGRFRFRLADELGGVEGVVADARQNVTLKPGDKGLLMHVTPRVPT